MLLVNYSLVYDMEANEVFLMNFAFRASDPPVGSVRALAYTTEFPFLPPMIELLLLSLISIPFVFVIMLLVPSSTLLTKIDCLITV